jgi:endonuclease/exonuclease/phosphatase family metal-dependent hydrolase
MSLKVCSYNIFFEKTHLLERTKALIKLLIQKDYDIIFLQEVTPLVLEYLIQSPLKQKLNYYFSKTSLQQGYDTVIISKSPLEFHQEIPLPKSQMGRKLEIGIYQGIIVGTTHLESVFHPKLVNIKKEQFKSIFEISQNYSQALFPKKQIPIILGLDTNITPREENDVAYNLEDGWKDIFQVVGSPEIIKHTYDYKRNDLIKNKYQGRLDRFYLLNNTMKIKDYQLVGQEEISDKVYISDHFGIELYLSRL